MTALAIVLLLWTVLPYIRVPAPFGFGAIAPRLTGAALSPYLALVAAAGAALAFRAGAHTAGALLAAATLLALFAALRIGTTRAESTTAFSSLPSPAPREARAGVRWQRDVPFWTIPDGGRTLLCDIWQPPAEVRPSGVAYIYFHGSAWYILDKDAYTRRIFRHLSSQGHVVMDVAYRLFPEADVPGMVGDVKRAVAWLKEHAGEYGVDPACIVIGGSSAGGHMVQLAGFAPDHAALTPPDVRGRDLTVAGIISCYGPSDLTACFYHTNQQRIPGVGATPPNLAMLNAPAPSWMGRHLGRMRMQIAAVAGRLDWLMGGTPEQIPEQYALCSPVHHVHAGCPPTLLLQGEHDLITSAAATRALFQKLCKTGVPARSIIFPFTDHGFDLVFPFWSPSARRALRETGQFLNMAAAYAHTSSSKAASAAVALPR